MDITMSVYWVKIINLSEIVAETHQFYNSEKMVFRILLHKTKCSQEQIFQTHNLMEIIHS